MFQRVAKTENRHRRHSSKLSLPDSQLKFSMADTSAYAGDFQLKSVIPDRAQVPTIADSGSILARQKASIYPQTLQAQTINPSTNGSPVIFKLSDTRAYTDLRSCQLEFDVTISGINTQASGDPVVQNWAAFDESSLAWINRIRVLVGGVLAEDIQEVNIISQIKKMMTYQVRNCIDKQIAGGGKYANDQYVDSGADDQPNGTGNFSPGAIAARMRELVRTTAAASNNLGFRGAAGGVVGANSYGLHCSIPLRLLSGFFNSKQWFYLRNASIQVEFYPETPQEALVNVSGTVANYGNNLPYYKLENLAFRMDNYILDNSIVEIIDGVIGTRGLVYGFETTTTMVTQFIGSNVSIPFTRAVSDATQFTFVAQPQALSNNYNYWSLSTWRIPGLDNVQLQIGATPMPLNTMNPQCRINSWMQMWNGDGADTLSSTTVPSFALDCSPDELAAVVPANTTAYGGPGKLQGIGISLRRTNTEGLFFVNAGYNTALDSGAMSLRFTSADAGTQYVGYAFLQFVRLMTLAGGRVSISS